MTDKEFPSWGNYPKLKLQNICYLDSLTTSLPNEESFLLPRGKGRSYGDVCLNDGNSLLLTQTLNNFISLDQETGILTVQSGVSLDEILSVIVPKGFFLPVTPGTKFVTIGGAIANDVHGKNHHVAGTFGRHILRLSLLRSDNRIIECSPKVNTELFNATIGGLGLTGLILDATITLVPIQSSKITQETVKFRCIEEFFEISASSDSENEYTVAWIDTLSKGASIGRGHFMRGNHDTTPSILNSGNKPILNCPFNFPSGILNKLSIKAFNFLYYNRQFSKLKKSLIHYEPFFYPLDGILNWNRMYGRQGFIQFQCVIPSDNSKESIIELLKVASKARKASFLAVIKEFGSIQSPGLMSFPIKGTTLCMDFPIDSNLNGEKTKNLYKTLELITKNASGKIYPAKDAFLSKENFRSMYPNLDKFISFIDPKFSSSFFRRVV